MPRGRRRKIEVHVPTDTQPEFELGDTAADIERRRQEREEREERETLERLQTERTEEMKREETGEGRTEKRARTEIDVESTHSRQKKEQIKSIFLSDSDEEAIIEKNCMTRLTRNLKTSSGRSVPGRLNVPVMES